MTREIDRAIDNQQGITDMNIEQIRNESEKQEVKPTGRCLFCHELLGDDHRWCDSDCRDDWEHERRMKGLIR